MSFILDALKKSDNERRRTDTPGIANIPERGSRKPSYKWIWIVAGLVAINLTVLGVMFLKTVPGTVADSNIESRPDATSETEQAAASFSDIVSQAKRSQPAETAEASAATPLPEIPATTGAIANIAPPPGSSIVDGPASFYELRAKGILQLPDMNLDIHVYSSKPADRFVFINMSKHKENSTLDEGPRVREITPDGVIMDYQGTVFLLPRE